MSRPTPRSAGAGAGRLAKIVKPGITVTVSSSSQRMSASMRTGGASIYAVFDDAGIVPSRRKKESDEA